MLRLRACGAAVPGLPGPGTPLQVRLGLAIALSVALHAALVFGVHPDGTARRGRLASMITARLFPLPAPEGPAESATALVQEPPPAETRELAAAEPVHSGTPGTSASPETSAPDRVEVPGPAPRYYLAAELDRRPQPLQAIEPEVPAEAGGAEGSVVLRLLIDERGSVDEATVVRAQPPGLFERTALEAFSQVRFSPGMLSGAAVKSQLLVEVQFRNRQPVASGRGY
jgi:periplasmic protein TonB